MLDCHHYHDRFGTELPRHVMRGEWRECPIQLWQDDSGKWTVRVGFGNDEFTGLPSREAAIERARQRIDELIPREPE